FAGLVAVAVGGLLWVQPNQAQAQRIAQGTYLETCRNAGMRGTTLEADCRDRDGSYRHTVLPNAFACEWHIAKHDGRLVCEGAGGRAGYGGPGYNERGPGYGGPGYGGPGPVGPGYGGPGYGDRGYDDRRYGDRGPGGPGYGGPGRAAPPGSYQHS